MSGDSGKRVVYSYNPSWRISFTLVAEKHIQHLRRFMDVVVHDSSSVPNGFKPGAGPIVVNPYFYTMWTWQYSFSVEGETFWDRMNMVAERLSSFDFVVGVDEANGTIITPIALMLMENVDVMVVPSTFSKQVFQECGVRVPVHVVHHGVDRAWIDAEPCRNPSALYPRLRAVEKLREKSKVLLFWLWFEPDKKGWDEVREVYARLRRERKDVSLVVKSYDPFDPPGVEGLVNVHGWLSEGEKMALYDLSDVMLLFSRWGAFEICGLESLARGTPVVAHRMGAWVDYMPEWLLVKEGERVTMGDILSFHAGYGYKIDVESTVDKLHEILDNVDEYKARVREYALDVLAREFTWEKSAEKLVAVLDKAA